MERQKTSTKGSKTSIKRNTLIMSTTYEIL